MHNGLGEEDGSVDENEEDANFGSFTPKPWLLNWWDNPIGFYWPRCSQHPKDSSAKVQQVLDDPEAMENS